MRIVAMIQQPTPSNGKYENPSDLIPTQTLTGFEWALVVGFCGVTFTTASLAVGYFIKRLVGSVDKLENTLEAIRDDLLKNYLRKEEYNIDQSARKEDYNSDQAEIWEELKGKIGWRECQRPDCPTFPERRKSPRTNPSGA